MIIWLLSQGRVGIVATGTHMHVLQSLKYSSRPLQKSFLTPVLHVQSVFKCQS